MCALRHSLLPRTVDDHRIWAHPYEFVTSRYVDSIKSDVAPYIDAVEVLNGSRECMSRSKHFRKGISANEQARGLAAELGMPPVAGSDAHQGRHYFTAWTVFPEAVTCYGDLVLALKEGRVQMPDLPLHR